DRPRAPVGGVGDLVALGAGTQLPLPAGEDERTLLAERGALAFAARRAREALAARRRIAVDDAQAQVRRDLADDGGELRLHLHGDEDDATQRRAAIGRARGLAVVDRLVDRDRDAAIVRIVRRDRHAGRRRRLAAVDCAQDRGPRRRAGEAVDTEQRGVALCRLDEPDRDDVVAAQQRARGGTRRRERVAAVVDPKPRQALAARAGLERGDLVAPHALAPAHRGDCARAEPPLRGGAQLGTARVAADGEDSAQRLERVERLLELRLER